MIQQRILKSCSSSFICILQLLGEVCPGEFLGAHGGPEATLHDLGVGTDGHSGEVDIHDRVVRRGQAGAGGRVHVFLDPWIRNLMLHSDSE